MLGALSFTTGYLRPANPNNIELGHLAESTGSCAEQVGQLDPQSLVAQSVDVLIESPSFIAGKLPGMLGGEANGLGLRLLG